jgi:hypothetical protein
MHTHTHNQQVGILQKMQACRNAVRLLGCYEARSEVMVVTDLCSGGDLQKLSDVSCVASGCLAACCLLSSCSRGVERRCRAVLCCVRVVSVTPPAAAVVLGRVRAPPSLQPRRTMARCPSALWR